MHIGVYTIVALALANTLVLSGCAPTYYTPGIQPVPRFEGPGDVQVSGSTWVTQTSIRGDISASVAPWKGLTISGSMGSAGKLFIVPDSSGTTGTSYFEAGPGYYWKGHEGWVMALQGLYGGGEIAVSVDEDLISVERVRACFHRFSIQPSFAWRSQDIDLVFSSRIGPLVFYDVQGSFVFDGVPAKDHFREHRYLFLFEPAFTIRKSYKRLIGGFQIGHSSNLAGTGFLQDRVWMATSLGYRHRVPRD